MPDELSEPLIDKDEHEWSEDSEYQPRHRSRVRIIIIIIVLQFMIICLLPVFYYLGYNHGTKTLPRLPTHPVFKDGFQLELRQLDDDFDVKDPENMKYKGLPRPELDDAWENLLNHMNIRVHPEEARLSNFTSIELNDGTGDLFAMPTVFHSLHCLKTMRHYIFPESYPYDWELFKPPFAGGIGEHMDHCFENLRQALMCQGDMSLYSYKWLPTQDMPKPLTGMDHVCIDWDKMMKWAAERSFSLDDGLLTSPYSDGPWDPNAVLRKR